MTRLIAVMNLMKMKNNFMFNSNRIHIKSLEAKQKTGVYLFRLLVIFSMSVVLSGCAHLDELLKGPEKQITEKPIQDGLLADNVVRGPKVIRENQLTNNIGQEIAQTNSEVGQIPFISSGPSQPLDDSVQAGPNLGVQKVEAFVAPLPLPQFIDAVFGEMLSTTYVVGKNVSARADVVSLRSSGTMSSKAFLDLVSVALEEYGVRVSPEDGVYRIVEDKVLRTRIPRFIKSRARVNTPTSLRPIIQFVELQALDSANVATLLRQAFGNKNPRLSIDADRNNNYAVLSGLPEDVDQAVEIIRQLDELNYAGAEVRRYTPKYWDVEEMSEALAQALRREGWQVAIEVNQTRTISLMPITYSNDLFIFAKSEAAHRRVDRWLSELDRPVQGGDQEQIFIYQVRNVDAQILAETANAALNSQGVSLPNALQDGVGQGRPAQGVGAQIQGGGGGGNFFTVDLIGNRILFSGTANEYEKLIKLLEQLDTPAPEVLIEVKIAEVTLTDETSYGVEFFIDDIGSETIQATAQTGGLGLGSNGITFSVLTGNVDAAVNAFASNSRVKVLSTPTLVARSGGSSSIQVGQDVPIITSQRAASSQAGDGPLDILQAVDYRSTGVLMQIEPIVFSEDRIDLTITQEVSSTLATANSTINSPTISNRTISTQLSLEDGQTAVMGGLIQEDIIRDDTGVPILKDIPILGQAFSNDALSTTRTELLVLITAYVLRGQDDKSKFVRYLSGRIDRAVLDESRLTTLLPKQF